MCPIKLKTPLLDVSVSTLEIDKRVVPAVDGDGGLLDTVRVGVKVTGVACTRNLGQDRCL